MHLDEPASALIGRIYDCALDTSLWPDVLGEITCAVSGCMADLSIINPLTKEWHIAASYNWPSDLLETAVAHAHLNPNAPLGLVARLGEPVCSTRDLDIEAFHNCRFWRTCFADGGFYDYVAVALTRTTSSFGYWGVLGDKARGPFSDEDLELARLLSPHIRRSVEISGMLGNQRVEASTLKSALNALASGALILEPQGTIRFLNPPAQAELARGTFLRGNRNRLIGVTPEAVQLVALLSDGTGGGSNRGHDVLLKHPAGQTLQASWVELDQDGVGLGSPTLLLLREPEAELTSPLSNAAAFYHLTTGETQMLAQVLNGHTLAEAAAILGVARSTVKSQLDAIYRKTNTHRQADLVRLVMSLTSPLRSKIKF
jgi:DNA-binding CsgD family transcriptional regulator